MQLDRIKFKIGNGKIFHVDRLRIKKDNCKPRKKKEYNFVAVIYLIENRVQQNFIKLGFTRVLELYLERTTRGRWIEERLSQRSVGGG